MRVTQRRNAFTLPEVLVAMALILFIMAILTEAFKAGLDSYRQLKAVGDLQEKLRVAMSQLRADLSTPHFANYTYKVSDASFLTATAAGGTAEREKTDGLGFVAIFQGATSLWEGSDTGLLAGPVAGLSSYRSPNLTAGVPDPTHSLHFTIHKQAKDQSGYMPTLVLPGSYLATQPPQDYWDATSSNPNDLYNSQWAEVAYFLRPNGTNAGTTPLYTLYRRQLLLVTSAQATTLNTPATGVLNAQLGFYAGLSCKPGTTGPGGGMLVFNSPNDLSYKLADNNLPRRRRALWNNWPLSMALQPTAVPQYPIILENTRLENTRPWQDMIAGDDIVLNDVISFDVRILRQWSAPTPGQDFDFVDVGGGVYDTCLTTQPDPAHGTYQLMAVQINIRVWDLKTQTTRQVTIVQDM
jgi:prepilin-type N-terminal cleavage/methylation domain-containing protein